MFKLNKAISKDKLEREVLEPRHLLIVGTDNEDIQYGNEDYDRINHVYEKALKIFKRGVSSLDSSKAPIYRFTVSLDGIATNLDLKDYSNKLNNFIDFINSIASTAENNKGYNNIVYYEKTSNQNGGVDVLRTNEVSAIGRSSSDFKMVLTCNCGNEVEFSPSNGVNEYEDDISKNLGQKTTYNESKFSITSLSGEEKGFCCKNCGSKIWFY